MHLLGDFGGGKNRNFQDFQKKPLKNKAYKKWLPQTA